MTGTDVDLSALRTPFKPEEIGKLPRVTCRQCSERGTDCDRHSKAMCDECGSYLGKHIHLDYVGHADVTLRLLEVDPEWDWQPKATDPDPDLLKAAVASGSPEIVQAVIDNAPPKFERDRTGSPVGLWIKLTVGGVTRLGVGSCPSNQNDAEKVLIGDALRNAAMRFGVAASLWAKGDRADPAAENATASAGKASRQGSGQSAADAFENATPAPPRQSGGNGHVEQHGKWLAAALEQAPKHATIEACKAVWQKSTEMVRDGKITKADAGKLQDLLRKRMGELKATPPVAADLDPDDPWADKVADITNDSEAEAVVAEAGELLDKGETDGARYERIGNAVEARLARISQKAAA